MAVTGQRERESIRALSDRLVDIQRPIRVLDAVAWTDEVAEAFFAAGARAQPPVDATWYETRPLRFHPDQTRAALAELSREVQRGLGGSPVAELLQFRIGQYARVIDLLLARGTAAFHEISAELYGRATDRLHAGGPTLIELGDVMHDALTNISAGAWDEGQGTVRSAEAAVAELQERLDTRFTDPEDRVLVRVDDGIVADAAAGADYIKLRAGATFSDREIHVLEVHEGWVHVGTTFNGRDQPWCTFLGKGTPATTATQEGLALLVEITSFASHPARLQRVTDRITGIAMAEHGATFLDVYQRLVDNGLAERDAYTTAVRVFRGSTPTEGPFTKDLAYSRGFLDTYNFIRLAVRRGRLELIPLLFCGKLALANLGVIAHLVEVGLVQHPRYLPPQFEDLSALAAWMAYSNLLNMVDLDQVATDLSDVLS